MVNLNSISPEKHIIAKTKHRFKYVDENGDIYRINHTKDKTGEYKRFYWKDGTPCDTVWSYLRDKMWNSLGSTSNERTGSPDQKPVALYERIIEASSDEGDLVLDPFCGCATTIIAANNLKRRWIGIDRRKDARYHIITRLMGISRKDREYIEKYATDKEWLDRQMQPYEMHYQTDPPIRADKNGQDLPELPHVYSAEPENLLTHAEMHKILVDKFGLKCWGCNYIPPGQKVSTSRPHYPQKSTVGRTI